MHRPWYMSFSTLSISGALRDNISVTRWVSKVKKTYIFASRCKDVHEGNPGQVRSMVLGRGRARKETIHHVLDSRPFSMVRGGSSAVVAPRIKLSKHGETCLESTISYELTSSKNLLVCIGARLGRGCALGMFFCRSHVRDRTNQRG
jgi:hypothetical protein